MATTNTTTRALGRARAQIAMLSAQFLLGMGENLIGKPDETSGFAKAASATVLGLHVLIGVGLLVSAALAIRFTAAWPPLKKLAWTGAVGVVVAFGAGVANMAGAPGAPGAEWWSFAMAAAFLEAFLAYGALLMRLRIAQR